MAHTTPLVQDGILTHLQNGQTAQLAVDTPDWYTWLENASSFTFRNASGIFTARKEQASNKRGGQYWRAYRKRNGKLYRSYLGKSQELTLERLQSAVVLLSSKGEQNGLIGGTSQSSEASLVVHSRPLGAKGEASPQKAAISKSWISTLPVPPTALIGREKEVQAVCDLLRNPQVRLLTLAGTGGVGKTRLALEAARVLRTDFADGVCFVPLAPISDPERVMPTIAGVLGLWEVGDRPLVEQVQDALRGREVLLLLDNFEQVSTAAFQLSALLASCPRLRLLVTSRAVLHLSGEYEFPVPPLTVPDLTHLPKQDALMQIAAVCLFIERARTVHLGFELTDANAHATAEICARLDGLPLAIELAAARIKLLPPQVLLKRLSHRLAILTGGARDLPARQQTLRNTIQWSFDLLSTEEQRLFRCLSVFVGGYTLEAATIVVQATSATDSGEGDMEANLLDGVTSLLDKSLLQQAERDGEEPRLLMLETIREFGLECLRACGEREQARRAHALYYLALAEEANGYLFGAQAVRWFERLEQEYENLRAAFQWTLECETEEAGSGIEIAVRLGSALWRFWTVRSHLSEGRAMLERLLAASERHGSLAREKALLALGTLLWHLGDYMRIGEMVDEELSLCRQLGDQQGVAHTLIGFAGTIAQQGDYPRAQSMAEESLAICRANGDTWRAASNLLLLGRIASAQVEHARAQQLLEESQVLYRELGYAGDMAWPLIYLARNAIAESKHRQARSWLEEAQALFREAGNRMGCAHALSLLGQEALEEGELVRAYDLLTECHLLNQETGNRRNIAHSLFLLASVIAQQGDYSRATALYEQSLTLARTLKHQRLIASCMEGLAAIEVAQEQAARAGMPGGAMKTPPASSIRRRTPNNLAGLTAREVEVLHLVAQGLSDIQIADQLIVSPRTITTHLTSIYNKLGVNSRTAAVHFAAEHHLT